MSIATSARDSWLSPKTLRLVGENCDIDLRQKMEKFALRVNLDGVNVGNLP